MPAPFCFQAYVVNLKDRRLLADIYISGNRSGWEAHNSPQALREVPRAKTIRFSGISPEAFAAIIFGARLAQAIS